MTNPKSRFLRTLKRDNPNLTIIQMKGNIKAMSETSMFSSERQSNITSMSNKPVLKPVLKFDIKIIRECPIHRVGKPVLKGNLPDVIHHTKGGGAFLC